MCLLIISIHKDVPQGSVLGPFLFTVNNHGQNVPHASLYLYFESTGVYCSDATLVEVVHSFQNAFIAVLKDFLHQQILNAG